MKQDLEWLEVLGRGVSGVCRKVRGSDGNIMVVKQIDISFVTPEEYESATREARLLSSLSHPNVIRFYDEFVDDEMLHIVMEYAPYGTLKQNLVKMVGLIPESSAVWIMSNIMAGLSFLHQRKIVHRDLKSDNIFIGENHVPKVGDFGVATRLNSAQPMAMSCVGTPLYLSPELCNGEPYNTKTDMWAAGVLMYEVCAKGRLPFAAGNQGAVINKILVGQYAPLSDSYSTDVHGLVGECLSRDPRRRPTAEEVLGRLETLYQAHMKQEAPGAHQDSTASGADHFTIASPNAGQRRAGNQPLWWEWASNNGFVSGKFRTLYGGTPHGSPSQKAVGAHPNRRRAGQRSSLNLGMGAILPFSRERSRPTSAPSTPSSTDSGARRGVGGRDKDLLDFLVSTPAILEGPLQGPLWRNPKSKPAKGLDMPVSPAWGHAFGQDPIGGDAADILGGDQGAEQGHMDGAHRAFAPSGRGMPLAFTTVDDLTGWLQQNVHLAQGESSEWRPDKTTRPTSSPDCSRSDARRPMGIQGRGHGLGSVAGLAGPPSRVIGLRLGADRLQHNQAAQHGGNQHAASHTLAHPEGSLLAAGHWGGAGVGGGNGGQAHGGPLLQGVHAGPVLHPLQQPLHVQYARGKKGQVQLSVNGVQPPATQHLNAQHLNAAQVDIVSQHKGDDRPRERDRDRDRELQTLQRLPSGMTAALVHPSESSAPGVGGVASGGGGAGGKESQRMSGLQLQGFGLNNNSSGHNVERPAASMVLRDLAQREGGNHAMNIKPTNCFKGSHLRQGERGAYHDKGGVLPLRAGRQEMGSSLQYMQVTRAEAELKGGNSNLAYDQVFMARPSC